jgi:type II secretory pathway component GspD/PulD (secretin)
MPAPEGAPPQVVQPVGQPGNPETPQVGPDGNPIPGQPPGKPGEPAKPEASKITTRPTTPETPANPEELKVVPDADGKVRFNFQGQPWRGVLEWLARISNLSLDWQELPADFLNLRTQRSYSLDEARDVINRHLLDRGFTMLKHGEILTVVNVKKIDPSLVPRVAPEALDERDPHEFVKVSFPLDSLTADTAKDELLPMMSPNGKLSPMKATNRIEAMDAAVNLREVRDMLAHEQSHRGRKRVVQEFKLEYTRASEVLDQLYELLGIEKKPAAAAPMNAQQMQQQMMQQQMEMQQQQQGGGKPPGGAKNGSQVHIIANVRENSLVAQAPADQMALIAEGVKLIDIPSARSQSLLKNMSRTQVYRLTAIDPEPLVKMLNELGDLDPTTRLQVDKKNRSIIAYAPLADHLTIRTLVTKLDGTDRKFEVIKLRRLEADYVAGSIEFMMGAGEKKKQQTNRYNPYFDFGFGGGRNNEEDESRKFRVDADIEHNRLLLWANPIEIEEINHLLVKLGEIPSEGGNLSTLRVLDSIPPEEVEELLQRLKRTWPGHGANPLLIVPQTEPEPSDPPARPSNPIKKPARKRTEDGTTTQRDTRRKSGETPLTEARLLRLLQVAQVDEDEADDTDEGEPPAPARGKAVRDESSPARADVPATDDGGAEGAAKLAEKDNTAAEKGIESQSAPAASGRQRGGKDEVPEPIRVGRGPDGRLIISSADTNALDRMEDLLTEITPPRKDYKVFKLKYKSTWAYGVMLNLKDFFKEKDDNKQDSGRFRFFYGMPSNNSTDDERRLSKRKALKFVSDSDSNSIIVVGADPAQLRTIEELIAVYDVPESKDSAAVRKIELVQIHYSKAKTIADAVKDVYRDLLSANDPALQNQNGKDNKNNNTRTTTINYVDNFGSGDDKKPDLPMKFKGLLSIGVDELSNTLVVSAADNLVDNVVETIEALDEAAKPQVNRMRVLKVNRHIDANELQKRLKSLVTKPVPPQQKQQQQQNQNQIQQQNAEGGVFNEN